MKRVHRVLAPLTRHGRAKTPEEAIHRLAKQKGRITHLDTQVFEHDPEALASYCAAALKQDVSSFKLMSDALRLVSQEHAEALCIYALQKKPEYLEHVPPSLVRKTDTEPFVQMPNILFAAIDNDPHTLRFAPVHVRTGETYFTWRAVSIDPLALRHVTNPTLKLCVSAVSADPRARQFVPKSLEPHVSALLVKTLDTLRDTANGVESLADSCDATVGSGMHGDEALCDILSHELGPRPNVEIDEWRHVALEAVKAPGPANDPSPASSTGEHKTLASIQLGLDNSSNETQSSPVQEAGRKFQSSPPLLPRSVHVSSSPAENEKMGGTQAIPPSPPHPDSDSSDDEFSVNEFMKMVIRPEESATETCITPTSVHILDTTTPRVVETSSRRVRSQPTQARGVSSRAGAHQNPHFNLHTATLARAAPQKHNVSAPAHTTPARATLKTSPAARAAESRITSRPSRPARASEGYDANSISHSAALVGSTPSALNTHPSTSARQKIMLGLDRVDARLGIARGKNGVSRSAAIVGAM